MQPGQTVSWGDKIASDGNVLRGFRSRNLEIAKGCDALVRIAWDPEEQARVTGRPASYGSGWTRDRAREMGKPTEEFVLTLAQDASGCACASG